MKAITIDDCTCTSAGVDKCPYHSQLLPDVPKQVAYFDDRYYWGHFDGKEIAIPSVTTILNIVNKPFYAKWRGDVGNDEADKVIAKALDKGSNIHTAIASGFSRGLVLYEAGKFTRLIPQETIRKAWEERLPQMSSPQPPVVVLRDQDEMLQYRRTVDFVKKIEPVVLCVEETVFSPVGQIAGTLDQLWWVARSKVPLLGLEMPDGGEGVTMRDMFGDTRQFLPSPVMDFRSKKSIDINEEGFLFFVDFKTGKNYDANTTFMQIASYGLGANATAGFPFQGSFHLFEGFGLLGIHTNHRGKYVKPYAVLGDEEVDKYLHLFKSAQSLWSTFNKTPESKPELVPTLVDVVAELFNPAEEPADKKTTNRREKKQ